MPRNCPRSIRTGRSSSAWCGAAAAGSRTCSRVAPGPSTCCSAANRTSGTCTRRASRTGPGASCSATRSPRRWRACRKAGACGSSRSGAARDRRPAGSCRSSRPGGSTTPSRTYRRGFFADAEARFGKSEEAVEFKVLDIEAEPAEQGFEPHAYDLVIAANVLHATRDPRGDARKLPRAAGAVGSTAGAGESVRRGAGATSCSACSRTGGALPTTTGRTTRSPRRRSGAGRWAMRASSTRGSWATKPRTDPIRPAHGLVLARGPAVVAEPPGVWVLAGDRAGPWLPDSPPSSRSGTRPFVVAGASDAGAAPTERPWSRSRCRGDATERLVARVAGGTAKGRAAQGHRAPRRAGRPRAVGDDGAARGGCDRRGPAARSRSCRAAWTPTSSRRRACGS